MGRWNYGEGHQGYSLVIQSVPSTNCRCLATAPGQRSFVAKGGTGVPDWQAALRSAADRKHGPLAR